MPPRLTKYILCFLPLDGLSHAAPTRLAGRSEPEGDEKHGQASSSLRGQCLDHAFDVMTLMAPAIHLNTILTRQRAVEQNDGFAIQTAASQHVSPTSPTRPSGFVRESGGPARGESAQLSAVPD